MVTPLLPIAGESQAYGEDHPATNKHTLVVGHAQKRMMSQLKAKLKPHFSPDGTKVRMGGKDRLTETNEVTAMVLWEGHPLKPQ